MNVSRYIERDEKIVNLSKGKKVLHLGCVGFTDGSHEEKIRLAKTSLHSLHTDAAADCIGIDLDGDAIQELKQLGIFTNVVEGDVEQLDALADEIEDFDVVVAGDIIEHLSNPGLMLRGVQRMMLPEGLFVVSTPNAFGIASWIKYLRGSFREGAQHVLCFNPITLRQILERNGFEVVEGYTCYQPRAACLYGRTFALLRAALERFPKFGGTLLYVCRRKHSTAFT